MTNEEMEFVGSYDEGDVSPQMTQSDSSAFIGELYIKSHVIY